MPKFPKRQVDIKALAIAMVLGYLHHADDFPSTNLPALATALGGYNVAKNTQAEALAAAQLATEQKDAKLNAIVELMKAELKKSEVDVAANPEKLALISWGPKAPPSPADPPGQPSNLQTVSQGKGFVQLKWDKPTGGALRNYIIEGRQQDQSGDFGPWSIVGTALNNEINLTSQPRGNQLEYRVKAVNTTGQSNPSNIAAAVL